jgi:hypothetical protein
MIDVCSKILSDGCDVVLSTDCRVLRTDRRDQQRGHLGSHPVNMACVLASDKFRSWRVREYIRLYYTLTSTMMIQKDGQSGKALVDFCNKGCHRSRAWAFIQTAILQRMGFVVNYNCICMKAMLFSCANPSRHSCEECSYDNPEVQLVLNVATDEFFEVVVAMQQLQ